MQPFSLCLQNVVIDFLFVTTVFENYNKEKYAIASSLPNKRWVRSRQHTLGKPESSTADKRSDYDKQYSSSYQRAQTSTLWRICEYKSCVR